MTSRVFPLGVSLEAGATVVQLDLFDFDYGTHFALKFSGNRSSNIAIASDTKSGDSGRF